MDLGGMGDTVVIPRGGYIFHVSERSDVTPLRLHKDFTKLFRENHLLFGSDFFSAGLVNHIFFL